jgi:DNA polymerase elongation subunit (family B)/DNA-directed RNA polymerase subunit RPC12/RpoP
MKLDDLVILMENKSYMLNMGAGKLAKQYKTTKDNIYKAKEIVRTKNYKFPKILLLDIETTPLEAYIWQTQVWKAHVSDSQVISKWFMLTWAAKWLDSQEVMSMRLNGKEVLEENDRRIVYGLWDLLDQADIVIAHNGDNFDIPNINTRFLVNGLPPTSPYRTIDTLKVAQRQFGFTHNSLNALARTFGFDEKLETDFSLWKRSKNGDEKALEYMEKYNQGDVFLLEEVYIKLRPWVKSHPNIGVYMETEEKVCAICGSNKLVHDGYHVTNTGKYPAYRCAECGSTHTRDRKSVFSLTKKKLVTTTIPR